MVLRVLEGNHAFPCQPFIACCAACMLIDISVPIFYFILYDSMGDINSLQKKYSFKYTHIELQNRKKNGSSLRNSLVLFQDTQRWRWFYQT